MSALAEHAEIREAVRRYAKERLVPNAARWDRDKEFPREALKGLAEMGLYGIAIPEEWGGAGLDYSAMAIACEEISAGDCATATIVMVNNLAAGIVHGYVVKGCSTGSRSTSSGGAPRSLPKRCSASSTSTGTGGSRSRAGPDGRSTQPRGSGAAPSRA